MPLIQSWIEAGGVPDGVDLVAVATGIDPAAPNYPPDAWLEREGWTVPVIADPTNSVATAYGLTGFPYWVFIGPDGAVRARAAGEMPIADLEAAIRGLTTPCCRSASVAAGRHAQDVEAAVDVDGSRRSPRVDRSEAR